MNVPNGTLETAIAAVVAFVFKVVFGLIGKNETKSDEKDTDLDKKIDKLDDRYRENDRELYERTAQLASEVGVLKAVVDCIKGKGERSKED